MLFAIATHALLRYTRVGKAIRAVADNRNLARSSGISAQRITDLAWLVSGLLGGAAGVMLGLSLSSVSYTMGDTFLMEIIAAAVLGGVGQVYGAMLGALRDRRPARRERDRARRCLRTDQRVRRSHPRAAHPADRDHGGRGEGEGSRLMDYYLLTMCVYVVVGIVACWGLNLQFGETGVLNFAYILFVAAGAYTASLLSLGHPHLGQLPAVLLGYQPALAAAVAGAPGWSAASSACWSDCCVLRRLRGDYQAMVMLVVSIMGDVPGLGDPGVLNGGIGLSDIPAPFKSPLHTSQVGYEIFYLGLSVITALVIFEVMRRINASPLGRILRAVRENEAAAEAIGHNVAMMKLLVMVIGGAVGRGGRRHRGAVHRRLGAGGVDLPRDLRAVRRRDRRRPGQPRRRGGRRVPRAGTVP